MRIRLRKEKKYATARGYGSATLLNPNPHGYGIKRAFFL
jgi:hypothetical protein